jgi:hypothetical protein
MTKEVKNFIGWANVSRFAGIPYFFHFIPFFIRRFETEDVSRHSHNKKLIVE